MSAPQRRAAGGAHATPPTTTLAPSLQALDALDVDALALALRSDARPLRGAAGLLDWRCCGRLSRLLLDGTMTGSPGEHLLLPGRPFLNSRRIFVFGWGARPNSDQTLDTRLTDMARVLDAAGASSIAVSLPPLLPGMEEKLRTHLYQPLGTKLVRVFVDED